MMLTLALASTPEHVYKRALAVFAASDVAEAFAACRSITIPSQLRSLIRADGRDLAGRFRQLAPARRPIPIQLWDLQRVEITAGLLAALAAAVALLGAYLSVAGLLSDQIPGYAAASASWRPWCSARPPRWPAAPHSATPCLAAGTRSGWRSSRSRCPPPPTCHVLVICHRDGTPPGSTRPGAAPAPARLRPIPRAAGEGQAIAGCQTAGASPSPARAPGVLTYTPACLDRAPVRRPSLRRIPRRLRDLHVRLRHRIADRTDGTIPDGRGTVPQAAAAARPERATRRGAKP